MAVVWRWLCDRLGVKVLPVDFSVLLLTLSPGCEASPIRIPRRRWVHEAPLCGGGNPRCRRLCHKWAFAASQSAGDDLGPVRWQRGACGDVVRTL